MSDHYVSVAERCEQQASLLTDEGRHEVATVLWEADARIRELEAENAIALGVNRALEEWIEGYRILGKGTER